MRVALLVLVNFLQCVFVSHARVIPKRSEDTLKDFEDLNDISKEKTPRNSFFFQYHNKNIRLPRNSKEQAENPKNLTKINLKSKIPLVKKPIPKFIASEEDYQGKIRVPNKFSDSIEHEDEDFNLDDYDFDVNHDEYSSGGKPLEPRKKLKTVKPKLYLEQAPAKLESILKPAISQSKVVLPRNVDKMTYKVARKAVDKLKEEEYDDEFSTTVKEHTSTKSTVTGDDSDESEEYIAKVSGRSIRSPLSFDKLGEKTSNLMSKLLTYLPMFPQIHESKKISDNVSLANPMVGPGHGKK